MSAFEVAFPPLWHAAKEVINPNTINPTVRTTAFRMRHDSRTNCGCKQIFTQAIEAARQESPLLMRPIPGLPMGKGISAGHTKN
jgi:hypothetical protein